MNPLKLIAEIRNLILNGYGYNQMLDKVNLTEEQLKELSKQDLIFRNEIQKRYHISLESEQVSENKEESVKPKTTRKKKSREGVDNANETVPEGQN